MYDSVYAQLYLREEIKGEDLVRNLPGFARFLPIAAMFHGQTINVAGIARDAGTARTTVAGYLDILDDTLLTFRLPGFEPRLRVRASNRSCIGSTPAWSEGSRNSWARWPPRRPAHCSRDGFDAKPWWFRFAVRLARLTAPVQ